MYKSEPLISVLIPSYNHAKYVIECLESIKNSDHGRIELIVSDDRSSDGTYDLASDWVHRNQGRFERALAIQQPQNLGIVGNLQFLFDQAHGKYLVYLASDDALVPLGITARLNMLEARPDLDAVFGNSQLIDVSGAVLRDPFVPPGVARAFQSPQLLPCALLRHWGLGGPVMMLRREAVLSDGSLGRLPETLKFEDRYIFIRLAALGKLAFLNTVVAKYRVVANSLSRSPSFSQVEVHGLIDSDRRNRPLLFGIDRLFLDAVIAKNLAELKRTPNALYRLRRLFWKLTLAGAWRILYTARACGDARRKFPIRRFQ